MGSEKRGRYPVQHAQVAEIPDKTERLNLEIAGLGQMPRAELVACWISRFGCPTPKGISRKLLVRAIAYEMQAEFMGSLRPDLRQRLLTGQMKSQSVARKSVLKAVDLSP